jgi:glycine dehydrogenase subunit 1
MLQGESSNWPYIPNATKQASAAMLREIGVGHSEELFSAIPPELRLNRLLDLPERIPSEYELRKHVDGILSRNSTAAENLSFLGGGCYQHYVPAVCDEINGRSEFLTAYSGKAYEDHGRWQALFEYASMMGELLNMDVVNLPTYDGYQAAASAMRMAANLTGRKEVLLPTAISPDKRSTILGYNGHVLCFRHIDFDEDSGQIDLAGLEKALSTDTAAVYLDNPNFFGVIEAEGAAIADLAHRFGALCIVGADPISLGLLAPPADYGADICCGDIQSLGMHMQFGGGHAGYIATRDDPDYVMQYPNRICGIVPTVVAGEYGFGEIAFQRTSFMTRENANEWCGTMANLWAITAGVYLALMGPQGMADIGRAIVSGTEYAMDKLSTIEGLRVRFPASGHFREFVLDFSATGKRVPDVNRALLGRGIFGGLDLSDTIPGFEDHSLYCVTEVHSRSDIDRLAQTLEEVLA